MEQNNAADNAPTLFIIINLPVEFIAIRIQFVKYLSAPQSGDAQRLAVILGWLPRLSFATILQPFFVPGTTLPEDVFTGTAPSCALPLPSPNSAQRPGNPLRSANANVTHPLFAIQ
jgi:hypothetical protein